MTVSTVRTKSLRFAVALLALIMMLALSAAPAEAKKKHKKKHKKNPAKQAQQAYLAGYTAGASQGGGATSVGQQCNEAQILSLQCVLKDGIYLKVL